MWRYYAHRLNGDGTSTRIANDLPLQGVALTRDFSGPGGITAKINQENRQLRTRDGEPVFKAWSTAIFAEKDGRIRNGGIVVGLDEAGPVLSIDAPGFSHYPNGQTYIGENSIIGADACDVARHVWHHLQEKPGGNLGMTFDPYQSGVLMGTREAGDGEDSADFPGPYVLADWQTPDLGKVFDDMAKAAPFEYLVDHSWDGEEVRHHMRIARDLGGRRTDLRFIVGENIHIPPALKVSGDDYADEVLILGSGEGRKMVRGLQSRPGVGRLRRAVAVTAKDIQTQHDADRAAVEELAFRLGDPDMSTVVVANHGNAPLGTYDAGDQIRIRTRPGWTDPLDLWVRILSITIEPLTDIATLTVARAEKIT